MKQTVKHLLKWSLALVFLAALAQAQAQEQTVQPLNEGDPVQEVAPFERGSSDFMPQPSKREIRQRKRAQAKRQREWEKNYKIVYAGCTRLIQPRKRLLRKQRRQQKMVLIAESQTLAQSPFNGAPAALPGTIIATHFDTGGEGIAYHDREPGKNSGQGLRAEEGVDTEYKLPEGNIGWIGKEEWLEYTVYVEEAGTYSLELLLASNRDVGRFHVAFNGEDKTGEHHAPYTGGWANFQPYTIENIPLKAGEQVMRVHASMGAFNLGTMTFTRVGPGEGNSLSTAVKAYPVPFAHTLNLDLSGLKHVQKVEVHNAQGQQVASAQPADFQNATLQLAINAPGNLFFVRVLTTDGLHTLKVIKE